MSTATSLKEGMVFLRVCPIVSGWLARLRQFWIVAILLANASLLVTRFDALLDFFVDDDILSCVFFYLKRFCAIGDINIQKERPQCKH